MTKTFYIIYQTINNINTKDYWGAHETSDINDSYLGSGSIIKKAVKKYGENNFSKRVDSLWRSSDIMYWIEEMIVDEEMVKNRNNYNQTIGGRGGFHHCNTPEIREKRNDSHRETCSQMSDQERLDKYSRDTKGSKNPRAKVIKIFNSKGEVQYECHGDFKNIIEDNNLPSKQLYRSLGNGGEPIYTFSRQSSETRVRNKFGNDYVDKYKGWYAQIVPAYK